MRFATLLLLMGCPYVDEATYDRDIRDVDGDGSRSTRFGGPDCRDDDPAITTCDADGDGVLAVGLGGDDCDDTDPAVHPGLPEICDGIDNDCDGRVDDQDDVADEVLNRFFADADADGFGGATEARACAAPPGFVAVGGDCDDARDDVYPGALERCGATDHDCDGEPQNNPVDAVLWYADADGDGARGVELSASCDAPDGALDGMAAEDCDDADATVAPGAVEVFYDGVDQDCDGLEDEHDQDGDGFLAPSGGGDDCDDADADVHPEAVEVCNGRDDDCDGAVDDADPSVDPASRSAFFRDGDGDGAGAGEPVWACVNPDPTTFVATDDDCDDLLASVFPGADAVEFCNGRDDDCDGVVDEAAVDSVTGFVDADGDGFGNGGQPAQVCGFDEGFAAVDGDCNDADPEMFPGAPEVCGDAVRQDCSAVPVDDCDGDGAVDVDDCAVDDASIHPGAVEVCDGLDNDCDGLFDGDDPDNDPATAQLWFTDADADGAGTGAGVFACAPPVGAVAVDGDCDDTTPTVRPGAEEVCDGLDNDCDGLTDDEQGVETAPTWFRDTDGDGAGDLAAAVTQCDAPVGSWVFDDTDCNDARADVAPGAPEVCDGVDNDCDGAADDADGDVADASSWYADADGDGYVVRSIRIDSCLPPAGFAAGSLPGEDCNDALAGVNPGATEVCNSGVDDDCNGLADVADPGNVDPTVWYADGDGDGYGDLATATTTCVQPAGSVANAGDCDDGRRAANPDAVEICDGFDNDCDGDVDDADDGITDATASWADVDADGFGAGDVLYACGLPEGRVRNADDCDDSTALARPGRVEVCDGFDNDCDGLTDDADDEVAGRALYREDGDGDGYASLASAEVASCAPVVGFTANAPRTDCDDSDPTAFPGNPEVWYNGVDNDCLGGNDYDRDSDGFAGGLDGSDCNDEAANINPAQPENWYDGIDQNCDGQDDYDQDGDGFAFPADCDDDPSDDPPPIASLLFLRADNIHPGVVEDPPYDGVDQDCGGEDDYDLDGDGYAAMLPEDWPFPAVDGQGQVVLGTDCDDTQADVRPYASVEVATDGVELRGWLDQMCSGTVQLDGSGPFEGPFLIEGRQIALVAGSGDPVLTVSPGTDAPVVEVRIGEAVQVDGADNEPVELFSDVRIEGIDIRDASRPSYGAAALQVGYQQTVALVDVEVENIQATDGAPIIVESFGALAVEDCGFHDNRAFLGAGVVSLQESATFTGERFDASGNLGSTVAFLESTLGAGPVVVRDASIVVEPMTVDAFGDSVPADCPLEAGAFWVSGEALTVEDSAIRLQCTPVVELGGPATSAGATPAVRAQGGEVELVGTTIDSAMPFLGEGSQSRMTDTCLVYLPVPEFAMASYRPLVQQASGSLELVDSMVVGAGGGFADDGLVSIVGAPASITGSVLLPLHPDAASGMTTGLSTFVHADVLSADALGPPVSPLVPVMADNALVATEDLPDLYRLVRYDDPSMPMEVQFSSMVVPPAVPAIPNPGVDLGSTPYATLQSWFVDGDLSDLQATDLTPSPAGPLSGFGPNGACDRVGPGR